MTLLSELVTTLRQRSDTVASLFFTDSELGGYLNAALAELDDLIVATSEDYKVTLTSPLTIASSVEGSNYFALPADFLKSRGVDKQIGGAPNWASLERFELSQRNAFSPPLESRVGWIQAFYRIEGSKCWVIPATSAAGIYRIWYVPRFTPLALGAAVPDHMDTQAWHQFAICSAYGDMLMKQDLDASGPYALKAAQQARIMTAAATRDAGAPRKMVNTRYGREGHRLRWGIR